MIAEIIKRLKDARSKTENQEFMAGIQRALIIVLEVDQENGLKEIDLINKELEALKK